mgnify:CR=1 FL=1
MCSEKNLVNKAYNVKEAEAEAPAQELVGAGPCSDRPVETLHAKASVKEDLEAAADGERVVGARRKSVRELAGVGAGAEVVGAGRARGESQAMCVKSSKV